MDSGNNQDSQPVFRCRKSLTSPILGFPQSGFELGKGIGSEVWEIWNVLLFLVKGSHPSQFFLLSSSLELSFASRIGKFDLMKSLSSFVTEFVTWGVEPAMSLTQRYHFVSYCLSPFGKITWPFVSVIESLKEVSTWFKSRLFLTIDPFPILG